MYCMKIIVRFKFTLSFDQCRDVEKYQLLANYFYQKFDEDLR